MAKIPTIIIIGADKGGVGKTTITRVLLDYLKAKGISRKVFDTEYPAGDLKRFVTGVEVIDISKVQSQMTVFDTIDPDVVSVVDLRAGLLTNIINELDQAFLLQDVRAGNLNLILLHVIGPTISSILEVTSSAEKIGGGAKHFLVKNYINDTTFFDWDNSTASPLASMKDLTITVPQLEPRACEEIQTWGCTFTDFTAKQENSRILRGRVNAWVNAVWAEFDRVGLVGIITQ